jgi:hypothetical protein
MSCGISLELVFLSLRVDLLKHFGSIYNNSVHSILNTGPILGPVVTENLIFVRSCVLDVNFSVGANIKPTDTVQLKRVIAYDGSILSPQN